MSAGSLAISQVSVSTMFPVSGAISGLGCEDEALGREGDNMGQVRAAGARSQYEDLVHKNAQGVGCR